MHYETYKILFSPTKYQNVRQHFVGKTLKNQDIPVKIQSNLGLPRKNKLKAKQKMIKMI